MYGGQNRRLRTHLLNGQLYGQCALFLPIIPVYRATCLDLSWYISYGSTIRQVVLSLWCQWGLTHFPLALSIAHKPGDYWLQPVTRTCQYKCSHTTMTRSFYVFFDLRLNKRLSKHSRHRWFEMPWHSLRCHSFDQFPHLKIPFWKFHNGIFKCGNWSKLWHLIHQLFLGNNIFCILILFMLPKLMQI